MYRGSFVGVDIKFCGMTRSEDVREGVALGADFVGVIFAGGPRSLTVERAAEVLSDAGGVRTVGVFGDAEPAEIAAVAEALDLYAVQLHGGATRDTIESLRRSFAGEVWGVLRIEEGALPPCAEELFEIADGVVLDANVPGQLGGTGVTLPWQALRRQLAPLRGAAKLVLAGGLRAENVATAIQLLRPEIVDVSSGVETAPGIKDRARMRSFRDAVRGSQ